MKAIDWVKKDGRDYVELDFDFPHPITTKPFFNSLQGGWLLIDPEQYWHIREGKLNLLYSDGKAETHFIIETTKGAKNQPLVSRITSKRESKDCIVTKGDFIYDLHENPNVPEHEFTLSAFGIPEPQGIVWDQPRPWYLYFAGGAVVLLGLAFFLRYLAKRRKNII